MTGILAGTVTSYHGEGDVSPPVQLAASHSVPRAMWSVTVQCKRRGGLFNFSPSGCEVLVRWLRSKSLFWRRAHVEGRPVRRAPAWRGSAAPARAEASSERGRQRQIGQQQLWIISRRRERQEYAHQHRPKGNKQQPSQNIASCLTLPRQHYLWIIRGLCERPEVPPGQAAVS